MNQADHSIGLTVHPGMTAAHPTEAAIPRFRTRTDRSQMTKSLLAIPVCCPFRVRLHKYSLFRVGPSIIKVETGRRCPICRGRRNHTPMRDDRRFRPAGADAGPIVLPGRLSPSTLVAVASCDDPMPAPEPPPGTDPGTGTPPVNPPLAPSGPIGPGTS